MKRWLVLLFVVIVVITAYEIQESFSLFENEKDIIVNNEIGKWKINVNGSTIPNTATFTVDSVNVTGDNNVRANYFAPGTHGYFDVVIDPDDTDVSIYFEILCRSDLIQNNQISVSQIENVDSTPLIRVGNLSYAGVIPLSDIKNHATRTIRFHIVWSNNDNNNEIDSLYGSESSDFEVPIEITFRQYLGEQIQEYHDSP